MNFHINFHMALYLQFKPPNSVSALCVDYLNVSNRYKN